MKRAMRSLAMLAAAAFLAGATGQSDANLEAALSWNKKGVDLLEKEKDHDGAIDCFHKALQLKSGDPIITQNLAAAYSQQGQARHKAGRFDEAVGSYRTAAELLPKESRYAFFVAYELYQANRMEDAVAESRKCLRFFPGEIDAYHLLGQLLHLGGECKDAIETLEKGLEELAKQAERAKQLEKSDPEKYAESAATKEARANRKAGMEKILKDARKDQQAGTCEKTFTSAHFDFHYESQRPDLVKNDLSFAQMFEDAYSIVGGHFGIYPERRFAVVFCDPKTFTETTQADEWVGGVFDGKIRIPVHDYSKEKTRLRQVICHEYTHALISTVTNRCPTWLNEGLAQLEEGLDVAAAEKRLQQNRENFLKVAGLGGSFLSLGKEQAVIAYDMSLSMTRVLVDEAGYGRILDYLRKLQDPQKKEADAFKDIFGRSFEEWVELWQLRFGE